MVSCQESLRRLHPGSDRSQRVSDVRTSNQSSASVFASLAVMNPPRFGALCSLVDSRFAKLTRATNESAQNSFVPIPLSPLPASLIRSLDKGMRTRECNAPRFGPLCSSVDSRFAKLTRATKESAQNSFDPIPLPPLPASLIKLWTKEWGQGNFSAGHLFRA